MSIFSNDGSGLGQANAMANAMGVPLTGGVGAFTGDAMSGKVHSSQSLIELVTEQEKMLVGLTTSLEEVVNVVAGPCGGGAVPPSEISDSLRGRVEDVNGELRRLGQMVERLRGVLGLGSGQAVAR